MPTAQRVMLNAPGRYTSVDVTAAPGVTPEVLQERVAAAVGAGYVVRTGEETAAAQADDVQGFVGILKTGLAVFAFIGLSQARSSSSTRSPCGRPAHQGARPLPRVRGGRGQVNRAVLAEAALLGSSRPRSDWCSASASAGRCPGCWSRSPKWTYRAPPSWCARTS
jgi:putative ABC transport system permease protein